MQIGIRPSLNPVILQLTFILYFSEEQVLFKTKRHWLKNSDFIFQDKTSIFDLTEANYEELLESLSRIFSNLYLNNFMSFNLILYAPMTNDRNLWVQGKLVPRFEINPLGTSDLNYFEKLHNEIICPVVPEQLCEEIQPYFA